MQKVNVSREDMRARSDHSNGKTRNAGVGHAKYHEPRIEIVPAVDPLAVAAGVDAVGEPFPLVLHRGARQTIRGHVRRGIRRVGILLGADVAVMLLLQELLRVARDAALLGSPLATIAKTLIPAGAFSSWQVLFAIVLCLTMLGNYRAGDHRRDPQALFAGAAVGLGLVWWHQLWTVPSIWGLLGFALATTALGSTLVWERLLVEAIVRRVRPLNPEAERVLVIGARLEAERASRSPALNDPAERMVVAQLHLPGGAATTARDVRAELVAAIERERIDTLCLVGSIGESVFSQILDTADAACCQVFTLPNECLNGGVEPQLRWHQGVPMLQLTRPSLRGHQLLLKRGIDVLTASVALVTLAPLLGMIATAVRLSSPGAVLFRQVRVGAGGRRFHIYKFRTMVADAEARQEQLAERSVYTDGRLFKVPDDPRITRLGRFLRRTSLDELPQLWNVVRGDMSLVGPRPPTPSEVALYAAHHYRRFSMRPGITGPWQVSGRNMVTDFEEVVRLETAYMRNWSLWKDFGIMARTIPVVVKMEGAH